MAVARRERNGRKKLISAEVYRSETFSLPRYIAKGSICSGQSFPFFAPMCMQTLPIPDAGVTAAFYKVRDFTTGMYIRVSPCRVLFSLPPSRFPRSISPEAIVFATIRALVSRSRSRCVSIPVSMSRFRAVFAKSICPLCIPTA